MSDFDYSRYIEETEAGRYRLRPDGHELLDDIAHGREELRVEHRVLLGLLINEANYYRAVSDALHRWAQDDDATDGELADDIEELNRTVNRDSIEISLP